MVFHWSLSDSKSPQVSRTLLNILAILNNVVVWMVSTHLLTSKSSSLFSNPLVIVPNAPITIDIIVTCMFHSFFFNSLARLRYLSFFSHSVLFCGQPGQQSRQFCKFYSFCWLLLGLVFWPRLLLLLLKWNIKDSIIKPVNIFIGISLKNFGSNLWFLQPLHHRQGMTQGQSSPMAWKIAARVILKTHKMVLDATLLTTQHYKLQIKGKE